MAEQIKQIKDSVKKVSGVRTVSSQPVLGNFGLLLKLEGSMNDLFKAMEQLKSLQFIQHVATFLPSSEEILPDKIGDNKIRQDAKTEIINYLQKIQGPLVEDFEDLKRQIDAILVQSQRSLAPRSNEIVATNVREAIPEVEQSLFVQRINRLEERVRSLEISAGRNEGRREYARESRALDLQQTQVSLKRRHIAILVAALAFSAISLILQVCEIFLN